MSFYKKGMRIAPHPDVPGVGGTVTEANDFRFTITWDDGDIDLNNAQADYEHEDLRVEVA